MEKDFESLSDGSYQFTMRDDYSPDKYTHKDYSAVHMGLATINPLQDKAFKIALNDIGLFRLVIKEITGNELSDGCFNFNNEITVSVNGKTIITDVLVKTPNEWIDVEGQQETKNFPFSRHLYYWAALFANGIDKGKENKYVTLLPVTVIVIYKDKKGCPLIEKANLSGNLMTRNYADKRLLNLIAVNSAKWSDASTSELKAYLKMLHNGIPEIEDEVDELYFSTQNCKYIYHTVREACAKSLLEHIGEDDENMIDVYKSFISEEEAAKCEARGEARGKEKNAINLLRLGVDLLTVAAGTELSESRVRELAEQNGISV